MDNLKEAVDILEAISEDVSVPRNVKNKVKQALDALNDDIPDEIKRDRALQQLDDLSDDPNIPTYTRTQIWSIVSGLEGLK